MSVLLTGKAEVHSATVPCHDEGQRNGPDPRQGHLFSHCFPAPQQRGQLRPADPGAQGQLEARVGGLCHLGLTGFLKNYPFPSRCPEVSILLDHLSVLWAYVSVTLESLPWWRNFFLVQRVLRLEGPSMFLIRNMAQAAKGKFSFFFFSNKSF